jgi:hypothetical protein
VLGTLIKHYLARRSVTKDSKARDDLVFDEGKLYYMVLLTVQYSYFSR